MNPPEWEEAKRRLQRHQDLNHQSVPKSIIKNASETGDDCHKYRRYSRYTVDEPQNIQLGVGVRRQEPGSEPHGFPSDVDRCSGASLKDRVNLIVQQRHPSGFLSQVRNQLTDGQIFLNLQLTYSIALSCSGSASQRPKKLCRPERRWFAAGTPSPEAQSERTYEAKMLSPLSFAN